MLTALLVWFAFANCRSSVPVAQCYLRGIALSLGAAVESIAARDPSLRLLSDFKSADVAYFSVFDQTGLIQFHTNPDLIGERIEGQRFKPLLLSNTPLEKRIKMGTGEVVFEFQQQLHLPQKNLILRLVLHTWQADQIVRRARIGGMMIVALLIAAWGFALWVWRLQLQDLKRTAEMAHKRHLAQLGEMAAVLAHEVRTPLAGIKGYAQLLAERLQHHPQQRYTGKIVAESERLEGLVNDLLTYARQEPLQEGAADLAATVAQAWEQLAGAAEQAGVQLQQDGQLDRTIRCSADRLLQVLLNLFTNAVQAMPEGGILRVSLAEEGGMAAVTISDTGQGFPEQALERIFEPFYTTRPSGSGLGLAVCRKIVEGYGGSMSAANGSTGGAIITIKLPLGEERV